MSININQKYFLSNNPKPEKYGLSKSLNKDIYILRSDGSQWVEKDMYFFSNEHIPGYGYMRLPELNFQELWFLLMNSKISDNLYGAAGLILVKYPELLLEKVEKLLFSNKNVEIDRKTMKALIILKLEDPINRFKVIGKHLTEIKADYERWGKNKQSS